MNKLSVFWLWIPLLLFSCSESSSTGYPPEGDAGSVDMADTGDVSDATCAKSVYGPGTTESSIQSGGLERSFRVHVPPGQVETGYPLVLVFHGGGGSGEQIELRSTRFSEIADEEGFVAVYPDGTGVLKTWNGGGCCGAAVREDVDDVGFVRDLLDHLEDSLCIDSSKVFATGMSNGGILSHRLACELSGRIAAIAPVAGTDMTEMCTPSSPVSVLQIHGSEDGHVPYEGGEGCGLAGVAFTSIPDTMQGWATRMGCQAESAADRVIGDGTCRVWSGCEGAKVELCVIEGGGHSWPGGVQRAGVIDCPSDGFQSTTFEASRVIWEFFESVGSSEDE